MEVRVPTFEEVAAFVRKETCYDGPLTEATTLQTDIGVYGDDMDELMIAYAKTFNVDLSGFLWYFHTGEEGINLSGLFVPKSRGIPEIPITIGMLHRFAESGRWTIEYPPHTKPRPRVKLLLLFVLVICWLLVAGMMRSCGR